MRKLRLSMGMCKAPASPMFAGPNCPSGHLNNTPLSVTRHGPQTENQHGTTTPSIFVYSAEAAITQLHFADPLDKIAVGKNHPPPPPPWCYCFRGIFSTWNAHMGSSKQSDKRPVRRCKLYQTLAYQGGGGGGG